MIKFEKVSYEQFLKDYTAIFGDEIESRIVIRDIHQSSIDHIEGDDLSAQFADDVQKHFGRSLDCSILQRKDDIISFLIFESLGDLGGDRAIACDDRDALFIDVDEIIQILILGRTGRNCLRCIG